LITAPTLDSESSLPDHVQVLDDKNEQVGDLHECKGLHGEAASKSKVAFACVDGILVFDESDLSASKFFAYPEELGEGRTGRLDGGKSFQYFAGNFGKDKMIFIDVEGEGSFTQLQFDAPLVSGYLDPENAGQGFVHTADGKLHKIDTLAGTIVSSVQATEPVDMDAPWYSARPNFTFAGDKIALVEPLKSVLKLIAKENLSIAQEIAVEGKPYQIVAVGGELSDH
jgi:zinc transport system substrate-binding protein